MKNFINTKNIIIGGSVLGIIILGVILYMIFRPQKSEEINPIDQGLLPIRIIQLREGREQDINFTELSAALIANALISERPFDEQVQEDIKNLGIDRIDLPPMPTEQIKKIENPSNPQEAIEKYLKDVYTVFRDNAIQLDVNQLTEEALDEKTQNIQSLLTTNTQLYRNLFEIEVPTDAITLHKNYIRIAQIQNSFLLGLLNATTDPMRLDINGKITVSLLQKIDVSMKQELQTIRQKYNLIYQKQS